MIYIETLEDAISRLLLILTPDSNKSDKQRKVTAAEDFLIIPPTTGNATSPF